ncbi:MAG: hypothetical protein H8D78_09970 [Chloroflexi bacterium]|nr:hypothetical protein [Chloroflexota bacterium]
MAGIGGDLPEAQRNAANAVLKSFAEKVRKQAIALQVPASRLKVRQATYLFVGRDAAKYHVVFADSPGGNQLNYRDLSAHGRLELAALAHQIRIEVGDVVWAFSYPVGLPPEQLEAQLDVIVQEYVNSVLQVERKSVKKISPEAIAHPEIASGIEKFHLDYPDGRVAFIIMQFTNTKAHEEIVRVLKKTLNAHDIVALRADDKQYMDDLFPNVKVYMHACQFGIAVFERITADDFNPNVSLEVGYMLCMGKDVLLLKDRTLKTLPTDLIGRLYREFDTFEVEATVPKAVGKWLTDKGILKSTSKKGSGV